MKKALTALAICMEPGLANAALCIPKQADTAGISASGAADWGNGTTQGLAFCSTSKGNDAGDTATIINTLFITDNNMYCWCKLIAPVASSVWVYRGKYSDFGTCAVNCAGLCAINVNITYGQSINHILNN